jgi:hypothetical protein
MADLTLTPARFDALQRETLEREIRIWPARSWSPSQLGHPCDRFQVWRFTKYELHARHDHVLQSIFTQGRDHQRLIYTRLEAMGFDIVREYDRPIQYRVRNTVISGRPDGKVRGIGSDHFEEPWILELKAVSSHLWDRLETAADLARSPIHYVQGYWAQGQLYCFLENLQHGVFIFENKSTGILKALPYTLDLEVCEAILQRVERLQPLVAEGIDPPPIPWTSGICGRCPFEATCYPARDFGEGAAVLTDTGLIDALERREQLKEARDEFDALDRGVRDRLKRDGVKHALAGPFVIDAREREVKGYTVEPRLDTIYTIHRLPEPKESAS